MNPLLRPAPLLLVAGVLVGWILVTAWRTSHRLEVARALVLAVLLSELFAQVLKRLAGQPRPLSVIPGLDAHGYPISPHGNAYPSAHTAVSVAMVSALWPWMSRPQRIVGAAFAVLIAGNRMYIGAHWPVDVLGGAAIGLLCGSLVWLVATRWPVRGHPVGRVGPEPTLRRMTSQTSSSSSSSSRGMVARRSRTALSTMPATSAPPEGPAAASASHGGGECVHLRVECRDGALPGRR